MAPIPRKLSMGKGAVVECLLKKLKPARVLKELFPHAHPSKKLRCLVIREESHTTAKGKTSPSIIVTCDECTNDDGLIEMKGHPRWFVLKEEGPEEDFFAPKVDDDNPLGEIPPEVLAMLSLDRMTAHDFEQIRGVVDFDDDNQPAPENIPLPASANDNDNDNDTTYLNWGHSGVCHRRKEFHANNQPSLQNYPRNKHDLVTLFELLFPSNYLNDVILEKINDKIQGHPVTYGEFLRWIGIWFLMATVDGSQRHDFWSSAEQSMYHGAPYRFNDMMSGNRFKNILAALEYTDDNPPTYRDDFHPIRKLVEAWNNNMEANFCPSWVTCLDESMMVWLSQWTCPGFMVVPRKPKPMGNEWHTIACAICGILFRLELVEGKDAPKDKGAPLFNELGKTVGLLLRLTKTIWGAGRLVILDSGFCVLQALVELKKRGVFASAVIKKRRYWPKHIKGDEIKKHFEDKEIGEADALPGILDNVPFHVYAMKEANFVGLFMSTYGTLERSERKVKKFSMMNNERCEYSYPEVFENHYKYRDKIDSHNAKRHAPISLEETWGTKWWPHRVFAFLLAVTEVNIFLASNYFYSKNYESMIDFRKVFAEKLIHNYYLINQKVSNETDSAKKRRRGSTRPTHALNTLPKNCKFYNSSIVESQSEYPQFKCIGCNRRVRTYCRCSPGQIRCNDCFAQHFATVVSED